MTENKGRKKKEKEREEKVGGERKKDGKRERKKAGKKEGKKVSWLYTQLLHLAMWSTVIRKSQPLAGRDSFL